ncbi:hypothetical protein TBLA_0H02240 [Henningerozyma blattae CBS 6284]|uniref:Knr4/Smi1-like domain-containing protein n=1 Tax=Henningerozyma blattae (strain ATCC 34711 / CBS 6284 / DSM 70876 / NBRC 10599 / NRRL Y-10934 / UCD 77-7) TaxID=1071380 RepID=I2H808_HENB6|nr:hypothetical protein TBLA_0H02240 [Tetrapisispora blattae CBS 6284]CCH62510.1 hypothetical protein TBLA_0H02240 [Tetrapisispora blattae CBS 6284]
MNLFKSIFSSFNSGDRYGDDEDDLSVSNNSPYSSSSNDLEMNYSTDSFANDSNGSTINNEGVSEALLAWRHISTWTNIYNPDLEATLSDPCTRNDIRRAENDLGITFPGCVAASLRTHDGQEDMESIQGTSGLIYGLKLMTLDQIVEMTENWRNVAKNMDRQLSNSTTYSTTSTNTSITGNSMPVPKFHQQFKLPSIPTQKSIPPNTIQPVYANANWIPLLTDFAGNHIGVDLDPAPEGKLGQVIIFGREFDTKYVIAKNWGDFLISFVDDLETGNWLLVDETDDYLNGDGDLVFRDKRKNGPIQDYLDVLRIRCIENYNMELKNKLQNEKPTVEETHPTIIKPVVTNSSSMEENEDTKEKEKEEETSVVQQESKEEEKKDPVESEKATDEVGNEVETITEANVTKDDSNKEIKKLEEDMVNVEL